jgi:F420-dependent oxidoreductase-like protein
VPEVKLGLHLPHFTWPGGAANLGPKLAGIARAAEDAGYASIWVMDHQFQIPQVGRAELEMLEAYTALGFIAANTSRISVGTLVTGVTYRNPGILVKQVTTLDVLSRGRAWLGIGAAWFEREHRGLGVPFPPLRERFERLEETLQIALQMWGEDNGPYHGVHYQLAETLNSPQCLSRPHPPILVGGDGERKTLRLVARYADACNLRGDPPTVRRRLEILREHCLREGRSYDAIEKTARIRIDVGKNGSEANRVVDMLGHYSEAGIQSVIGSLVEVEPLTAIETVGRDVIPQVATL